MTNCFLGLASPRKQAVARLFHSGTLKCAAQLNPPLLHAKPHDGQLVRGHDFEGVIFTPGMFQVTDIYISFSPVGQDTTWTPSLDLILKAEAALPAAIAKLTRFPRNAQGVNRPTFYTAKHATSLNLGDEPPDLVPAQETDREYIRDFVYDLVSCKTSSYNK